jgi:hypothetical protein
LAHPIKRKELSMKGLKFAGTFLGVFLALILLTPAVRASETNQMTKLKFNQSIQIPGAVLPAGTYWFVVPDRIEEHDIVYVYNADRSDILAVLLTRPTTRTTTTESTELTLAEQSQGAPYALISWFYSGRTTGHDFIYPSQTQRGLDEERTITVFGQNANDYGY